MATGTPAEDPGACPYALAFGRQDASSRPADYASGIYPHRRRGTLRVGRLVDQSLKLLPQWRLAPVVEALQALRGVAPIVAITTVSEIGDITRFENPRQFMAYLGLVPSEHSSGQSVKRGSITKTGNGHVRRVLVEAAQAYSYPARISRFLLKRQQGLPLDPGHCLESPG